MLYKKTIQTTIYVYKNEIVNKNYQIKYFFYCDLYSKNARKMKQAEPNTAIYCILRDPATVCTPFSMCNNFLDI